jgi:hypothetical protein
MNSAAKNLPVYRETAACKSCGGACCKQAPGLTSPEDWGAPNRDEMVRRIAVALRSTNYGIDWWDTDVELDKTLYIRPATAKGRASRKMRDPSWGGRCALHTDAGCSLSFDERPFECRALKPNPNYETDGCTSAEPKLGVARMWTDYQDVIEQAERLAKLDRWERGA